MNNEEPAVQFGERAVARHFRSEIKQGTMMDRLNNDNQKKYDSCYSSTTMLEINFCQEIRLLDEYYEKM